MKGNLIGAGIASIFISLADTILTYFGSMVPEADGYFFAKAFAVPFLCNLRIWLRHPPERDPRSD